MLLVVVALPSLASGIYAIVAKDHPENLSAWLGLSDNRLMGFAPEIGFTVLGTLSCVLGAAALAASLALLIWPDKALSPRAPLGRVLTRLIKSRTRRRRD